jgi:hypothetical protein
MSRDELSGDRTIFHAENGREKSREGPEETSGGIAEK